MVALPLALSWEDIFSPLAAAAAYVLQGMMNFTAYVKCIIMGGFYDACISFFDNFPTDWKSSIDTGLSGASTVFKSANIFLPMSFIFGLLGFLILFSLSFWVLRFLCRLQILGFKLGG